jgi:uncharacterized membrane-anchored protein
MWSLLVAGAVIGIAGWMATVYSDDAGHRRRVTLGVITLLQVVAVLGIVFFFLHQQAHWYDCG